MPAALTVSSPQKSTTVRVNTAALRVTALRAAVGALQRVSPDRAAALALDLWSTPRRHRRPEREQEQLRSAQAFSFPTGDGRWLSGWSWGEGPCVLLVHGWEGRGAQLGELVDPLLRAGFRVVTFDAPGHGDSPGTRATAFDLAEAALSAARWVGGVHGVVAHSLGALATALAMRDGLTTERVALIAPTRGPQASFGMLGRLLGLSPATLETLQARLAARSGLPWDDVAEGGVYRHLAARALVVHDGADKEVPLSDGQYIAARTGARLVVTEGLGHRRILKDEGVIERVAGFLAEGSAEARASWDPWRGFLFA